MCIWLLLLLHFYAKQIICVGKLLFTLVSPGERDLEVPGRLPVLERLSGHHVPESHHVVHLPPPVLTHLEYHVTWVCDWPFFIFKCNSS